MASGDGGRSYEKTPIDTRAPPGLAISTSASPGRSARGASTVSSRGVWTSSATPSTSPDTSSKTSPRNTTRAPGANVSPSAPIVSSVPPSRGPKSGPRLSATSASASRKSTLPNDTSSKPPGFATAIGRLPVPAASGTSTSRVVASTKATLAGAAPIVTCAAGSKSAPTIVSVSPALANGGLTPRMRGRTAPAAAVRNGATNGTSMAAPLRSVTAPVTTKR